MDYRLPKPEDKEILEKYIQEHHEYGENSISASMGLINMDFMEWQNMILQNAEKGNEQWGRSLLYLCFDRGELIGLLSVRYELNNELSEKYGDIGYGVRPSQRGKGYATEMLKNALDVCKERGKRSVLIGCYKDNLASAGVIKKCGGILITENENYKEGRKSQYYIIDLN